MQRPVCLLWISLIIPVGACSSQQSDPDFAQTSDMSALSSDLASDLASIALDPRKNSVAYLRAKEALRLQAALQLSDGSFLLAGGAQGLSALPEAPRIQLQGPAAMPITGQPGGRSVGFLLHLSADLGTIHRILHLPEGAALDIRRLRTTSEAGEKTGAIYLSGTTKADKAGDSGVFIGRLDQNLVDGVPTRFTFVRNYWATADHQSNQPWDVGADGKVVYVRGQPFGTDWAAVERLTADGKDDVVPDFRYHFGKRKVDGAPVEGGFTPATSRTDITVEKSAILFKIGRCELRSWTAADYGAIEADGNGKTRKGRWPLDLFFSGPCDPANPTSVGPGYTGYRAGSNPTQRIGAILVDRRGGDLYIGFSIQSRLPDGQPDFEPAVIAYTASGRLKWWRRLYEESPANSTPDQYVDTLAIDRTGDANQGALVVGARCHGNNTINLWRGNQVEARKGLSAFQNQFTGTSGNIHISWLGKLGLVDGNLRAATYVAEYADGMAGTGAQLKDTIYDGWPDPNAGWAELNTTRFRSDLAVDKQGRVYILATGRRTLTTANAYQKMIKKAEGSSSWNDFVRVYGPDLSTVSYSSVLTGTWDPMTGQGGGNITLSSVLPIEGGVLVLGTHEADGNGVPLGNPLKTTNLPGWGAQSPSSQAGVLGKLLF